MMVNMGIRDKELERLVQYATGLGIKVEYRPHTRGDPGAYWETATQEIILFQWKGQSKTRIILNFIHELAHHMGWIYSGRINDPKTDAALIHEDTRQDNSLPTPKKMRKLIYLSELNDSKYREQIYHEVGLKFSMRKLRIDIELDVWIYNQYYLKGKMPTMKESSAQKRVIEQGTENDA